MLVETLLKKLDVVRICVGKQEPILRRRGTFLHGDENVEAT